MPPGELLRCARGGPRLRTPPQRSDSMEGTGVTDTSTFTSPWTDRYACTCERAAAGVAGAGQHACIFVAARVAGPPSRDERACTRSGRAASARSNLATSVLRRCASSCLSCLCAHAVPGKSWCASVRCRDVGDGELCCVGWWRCRNVYGAKLGCSCVVVARHGQTSRQEQFIRASWSVASCVGSNKL